MGFISTSLFQIVKNLRPNGYFMHFSSNLQSISQMIGKLVVTSRVIL